MLIETIEDIKPADEKADLASAPLTKSAEETVIARIKREPEFAVALFDEALLLFCTGEPDVCRLMLRDLVNATMGFELLAAETQKPSKSLHWMLSATGNPTMDNLAAIIGALRKQLHIDSVEVKSVTLAQTSAQAKKQQHEQLQSA